MKIKIADIHVGDRLRALNLERVEELAKSIAEIGLKTPISVRQRPGVWGGWQLVSGLHRLEACRALGFEEIEAREEYGSETDARLWEISENLHRAELTALERSEHIAEWIKLTAEKINDVSQFGTHQPRKPGQQPGGIRAAARELGISKSEAHRAIRRVEGIAPEVAREIRTMPAIADSGVELDALAKAEPQRQAAAIEAIRAGTAKSVREVLGDREIIKVANFIKREKKEASRAARLEEFRKAAASVPPIGERYKLYHADCGDLSLLEPDSVDLIVTDPPYAAEYLDCYDKLGALAARVLRPGGLAIVMTGQSYLFEVMQKLNRHLTYHWEISYLTPGPSGQQHHRQVYTSWKPVLIYVRGKRDGGWFGDVVRSDPSDGAKFYHDWGQSLSGMRDLMRRFVLPGHVVLDPFLGGGTAAVVALELGAYFVGFDVNENAIAATRARIAEASGTCLSLFRPPAQPQLDDGQPDWRRQPA